MPREKRLAAIETILENEKEPLTVRKITEKAVKLKLLAPADDVTQRVSVAVSRATSGSHRKRPRIVKIGRVVVLGEWFSRWPPTVRDTTYFLLRGTGQPMHYSGITAEIGRLVHLRGRTPEMTVNATLSRDKRFVNLGAGVFGLIGMVRKFFNPNDFFYSTPAKNWEVSEKLGRFLPKTDEVLRVASPYIDKSTFETFLDLVPKEVEVLLLAEEGDRQMPSKVREGLSSSYLYDWMKERHITIRKLPDLHSRFLVVDDALSIVSSADLMKDQQQKKNQYILASSDATIVKKSTEYFDLMWREASNCNLLREIREIEKTSPS